jgi:hypothetical protein
MLVYGSAIGSTTVALFSSCMSVCAVFGCAGSAVESEDQECEEEPDGDELYDVHGFDEASWTVRRRSVKARWASVARSTKLVAWEFHAFLLEFWGWMARGARWAVMRWFVKVRRKGSVMSFSVMGFVKIWWRSIELGRRRRHVIFLRGMGSMRRSVHARAVMEVRFVFPFWWWSWGMSRGLSRFPMMRRLSVVRWWWVSADWKRTMWEMRLSWMGVVTLWWPSAVLTSMEGWMFWEMRFLNWNLWEVRLETWVVKLLIILIVSSNRAIYVVSSMSSLLSNCLNETLEAIACINLWFEAVRGLDANGLLFLEDQICELL